MQHPSSAFDRRSSILNVVRDSKRVSTRRLSELFNVSEVTIRQDLALLEEQGWIARVHGGAESTVRLQAEETLAEREILNLQQKQRIGKAAAELVRDGDTILLDSSSTAFQMTPYLAEKSGLKVITNQFHVARVLTPVPSLHVVLLGGTLRVESWSLVGPLAEDMLSKLHASTGFFGTAGITLSRGLTDADPAEAQIKQAMARIVDRVVVLADETKFTRQAMMQTIPLDRVSRIIATTQAPQEVCASLQARGITVQTV